MNKVVSIYLSFQKHRFCDDNFVAVFFNEGTRLWDYCLKETGSRDRVQIFG